MEQVTEKVSRKATLFRFFLATLFQAGTYGLTFLTAGVIFQY